jgi:hypothetical protein
MNPAANFRRSLLSFGLIGMFVIASGTVRAQDPTQNSPEQKQSAQSTDASAVNQITAVPNRPTLSTSAESVQPGVFEIEYGVEAGDGHQNINGLLKFGLTKNLEMRFANNPIERDGGVTGHGDSGAGFKYKVVQQRAWHPTVSALFTAGIPTATAGVGIGAMGYSGGILLSKDFGKHHFDFNEVALWLGRPGAGGFDRNYFTALAYSHGVRGKWGITGEIAGFSRANAATPATLSITAGATYTMSPRLVLDTGVYVAGYGNLPRVTSFCGVTYSVADLYHRGKN